jgi:hypothetical protein
MIIGSYYQMCSKWAGCSLAGYLPSFTGYQTGRTYQNESIRAEAAASRRARPSVNHSGVEPNGLRLLVDPQASSNNPRRQDEGFIPVSRSG